MTEPRRRKKRATLEVEDVAKARAAAATLGALEHAYIEWIYTNGARASEPGLARLSDVDMRAGTVQLVHLKGGLETDPMPMSEKCKKALAAWLKVREHHMHDPRAQADYLFPTSDPRPCYPCRGKKKILAKRRRSTPELVPCPHCRATGVRWGLSRHQGRRIVAKVFRYAGLPVELAFPHVFRHSAASHMLDKDINPAAIQERLGHRAIATTFGYIHTTKKARAAVNRAFDE